MTPLREACRLVALVSLAAGSLACRDIVYREPTLPAGAEPFEPPAAYAEWWHQTEACSGREGDFRRVRWFVVPNADYFVVDGRHYEGMWYSHFHYIALASAYVSYGLVVRHEMLHDLLDRVDHPPEYFRDRCGGLVSPG